jgi:hypothetical protein
MGEARGACEGRSDCRREQPVRKQGDGFKVWTEDDVTAYEKR